MGRVSPQLFLFFGPYCPTAPTVHRLEPLRASCVIAGGETHERTPHFGGYLMSTRANSSLYLRTERRRDQHALRARVRSRAIATNYFPGHDHHRRPEPTQDHHQHLRQALGHGLLQERADVPSSRLAPRRVDVDAQKYGVVTSQFIRYGRRISCMSDYLTATSDLAARMIVHGYDASLVRVRVNGFQGQSSAPRTHRRPRRTGKSVDCE